jgi:hypothetical protein
MVGPFAFGEEDQGGNVPEEFGDFTKVSLDHTLKQLAYTVRSVQP